MESKQDLAQEALLGARTICEQVTNAGRGLTAEERTKVEVLLVDVRRAGIEIELVE